ncbi:MAG: hypothetical protein ACRDGM_18050 [bacterium]
MTNRQAVALVAGLSILALLVAAVPEVATANGVVIPPAWRFVLALLALGLPAATNAIRSIFAKSDPIADADRLSQAK